MGLGTGLDLDVDLRVFWQVVKWVLVVLAAGFVGQFGRHLAKLILERRRHRQAQARLEAERLNGPPAGAQDATVATDEAGKAKLELEKKRLKERAKLEKKRAKAEVKAAKKAGKK